MITIFNLADEIVTSKLGIHTIPIAKWTADGVLPGRSSVDLVRGPDPLCGFAGWLCTPKMRFGHTLQEKQRPDWSEKYIQYKALKKLIKRMIFAQESGDDVTDLQAAFVTLLEEDLKASDEFFEERISTLHQIYVLEGEGVPVMQNPDNLATLKKDVHELSEFAVVNREAARKILKKMVKHAGEFRFTSRLQQVIDAVGLQHAHEKLATLQTMVSSRNRTPPDELPEPSVSPLQAGVVVHRKSGSSASDTASRMDPVGRRSSNTHKVSASSRRPSASSRRPSATATAAPRPFIHDVLHNPATRLKLNAIASADVTYDHQPSAIFAYVQDLWSSFMIFFLNSRACSLAPPLPPAASTADTTLLIPS